MLLVRGPGRRVLRVSHNGEHVCGRSRCSRGVESIVLRDSKLDGRAAPAPRHHGILVLGGPRQRAVDVQFSGILRKMGSYYEGNVPLLDHPARVAEFEFIHGYPIKE